MDRRKGTIAAPAKSGGSMFGNRPNMSNDFKPNIGTIAEEEEGDTRASAFTPPYHETKKEEPKTNRLSGKMDFGKLSGVKGVGQKASSSTAGQDAEIKKLNERIKQLEKELAEERSKSGTKKLPVLGYWDIRGDGQAIRY